MKGYMKATNVQYMASLTPPVQYFLELVTVVSSDAMMIWRKSRY